MLWGPEGCQGRLCNRCKWCLIWAGSRHLLVRGWGDEKHILGRGALVGRDRHSLLWGSPPHPGMLFLQHCPGYPPPAGLTWDQRTLPEFLSPWEDPLVSLASVEGNRAWPSASHPRQAPSERCARVLHGEKKTTHLPSSIGLDLNIPWILLRELRPWDNTLDWTCKIEIRPSGLSQFPQQGRGGIIHFSFNVSSRIQCLHLTNKMNVLKAGSRFYFVLFFFYH